MSVKSKVVLITGGAGGLCGATARLMAAEGATVVITDVSDTAGRALADAIGGRFHLHDVSEEARWGGIVDDTLTRYGRIDVLINGAGIEGDLSQGGALNTTLDQWRRVMSINLDGTFLGCRAVMPSMIERGTGSVINISSAVAAFGTPTALAYGASKAGVQQLTQSLALIGAKDGRRVRCNSLHPGIIKSRMTDNIIQEIAANGGLTQAQAETALVGAVPFGVRGSAADVARMSLFLASEDSAYVTGSAFQVDGGWHVVSAG